MKTVNLLKLSAAALILVAGSASALIGGSKHDFSSAGWNPDGEICETCHTPHNALVDVPLWNHTDTVATFTLYSSTSLDATMGQPDGVSKMCMGCHDGTVALDSFGGVTGSTNITGVGLVGTDLSNDHPVSFTYNTALSTTDGELADPSTVNSGLGGTIDADMLFSNKMECSSCHDVHNSAGLSYLLIKSNVTSALCLTCHTK